MQNRKTIPLIPLLIFCSILTSGFLLSLIIKEYGSRRSGGNQEERKVIIQIADKGFKPQEVTIAQGGTVIFANMDAVPHWPASDYHPTHELYPEFDPQKPIQPGESWSFDFEKEGTWSFHDHINPDFNGLIEVVGENSETKLTHLANETKGFFYNLWHFFASLGNNSQAANEKAKEIFDFCTRQKLIDACLRKQFGVLSRNQDFKYVLEAFREVINASPVECHQIAHEISRVFVEKDFDGWLKFLGNAPDDCNYGFIHGTIEAYGRLSSTKLRINPDFIRDICLQVFEISSKQISSCVHVFGHMLLVSEEGNVHKSLDLCLTLKNFYGDECFHGVFMENITKINLAAEGLANINVNQPISKRFTLEQLKETEVLCNGKSKYPVDLCWREVSHAYTFISNFDPVFSFKTCAEKAPTKGAKESCVVHALHSMIAQNQNNPSRTQQVCFLKTVIPNFLEKCHIIIVQQAIYSTPQNRAGTIAFCNKAPLEVRSSCFKTIGKTLKEFGSSIEKRKTMCSKAEPLYRNLCVGMII